MKVQYFWKKKFRSCKSLQLCAMQRWGAVCCKKSIYVRTVDSSLVNRKPRVKWKNKWCIFGIRWSESLDVLLCPENIYIISRNDALGSLYCVEGFFAFETLWKIWKWNDRMVNSESRIIDFLRLFIVSVIDLALKLIEISAWDIIFTQ